MTSSISSKKKTAGKPRKRIGAREFKRGNEERLRVSRWGRSRAASGVDRTGLIYNMGRQNKAPLSERD